MDVGVVCWGGGEGGYFGFEDVGGGHGGCFGVLLELINLENGDLVMMVYLDTSIC